MSWAIMNTYGMAIDASDRPWLMTQLRADMHRFVHRKLYMTDFEKTGDFTGSASDYAGSRDYRCKEVKADSQVQAASSAPTWTGVMPRLRARMLLHCCEDEPSKAVELRSHLYFFRYWSVNRA